MTSVYINYPVPHFSVKSGQSSESRMRHEKAERRFFRIDPTSFSSVISQFISGHVRFAADSGLNDIWLNVDFGSPEFEEAVIQYVQEIFGRRYKPLRDAEWRR